jgi:hypothetical protein
MSQAVIFCHRFCLRKSCILSQTLSQKESKTEAARDMLYLSQSLSEMGMGMGGGEKNLGEEGREERGKE